jgi:nucleoside-diphosphate-sugar epimerase
VDIYYSAIRDGKFTCPLKSGTFMDMMYMPDALRAAIDIMEADPTKLIHRNSFNITAMSFDPEMIAAEIKKHIPEFTMDYQIDELRQSIADSWPNSMDDSCARAEWGWKPNYGLAAMTEDMICVLKTKKR